MATFAGVVLLIGFEAPAEAVYGVRQAKANEAENISKFTSYVKRINGELHLSLKNGTTKVFKDVPAVQHPKADTPANLNELRYYVFLNYLAQQGYYLVREIGYEWDEYLLVHSSDGRVYDVHDLPILSPKEDRFIVVTGAGYAGQPEGIYIWHFAPDGLVRKWVFETNGLLKFLRWQTNDAVVIQRNAVIFGERIHRWHTVTIRYEKGAWIPDDRNKLE